MKVNVRLKMLKLALAAGAAAMMTCSALAATEVVDGIEWTYTVSGGKASVGTGKYSGARAVPEATDGAIVIPSTLGGCPVTDIGDYAFYWCSALTDVTIPPGVTSIGEAAFWGCYGLTNVTISSGVVSIGSSAFWNCWSIKSVSIPSSVTSIGEEAFESCDGLTNVTISSSVTSIGGCAFYACGMLERFDVDPDNPNYKSVDGLLLSKDGKTLVAGVNGAVTIPDGVTSIEYGAFSERQRLISVTIPSGVTKIEGSTFYGCTGLKSVEIPSSVTSIGNYAFDNCSGLENVTLPVGVTSLGDSAFYGCGGLTNMVIPSSVTSIGDLAFCMCGGLEEFDVDPANSAYKSVDGLLLTKNGKTLVAGVNGTVTIPDGVTSIGVCAFNGLGGLVSVNIPSSVTSLGNNAFYSCTGLVSFVVNADNPNYKSTNGLLLTKDGTTLVKGVKGEDGEVTIPDGVTSIGSGFVDCSGLKHLRIPSTVSSIGSGYMSSGFYGCNGLVAFDVDADNPYYKSVNGLLLTKDGKTLVEGVNGTVTIPDGVTSIGDWTFACRGGLTGVTISSSVTNIGMTAFYWCRGLADVTIPTSVTSIGDSAFLGCHPWMTVHVCRGDSGRVRNLLEGSGITSYLTIVEDAPDPRTAKAVWDKGANRLTFVYDENDYGVEGTDWFAVRETGYESKTPWHAASGLDSSVTNVVFAESFRNYRPKHCHCWFYGFSALKAIDGMENLDVSEATSLRFMFYGCGSLTSLDVSGFDTANVTDMAYMFDGSSVTNLDLSGFDTHNVTDMQYMFFQCQELLSLDVSNFNTTNVTTMDSMFRECSVLTSLDLSSFNATNVTTMESMFCGSTALTALDLSNFNAANVENLNDLFYGCSSLVSLDVSGLFKSKKVWGLYRTFSDCSSIKKLDLSGFVTENVGAMADMFLGCESLVSLDVSSFDTSRVKDMSRMFCMCSSLVSLDVSSFDTSKVKDMSLMFYGCSSIKTIFAFESFVTNGVKKVSDGLNMFKNCTALTGGNGTAYDANQTGPAYAHIDGGPDNPGYFSVPGTRTPKAVWDKGANRLTFVYDENDYGEKDVNWFSVAEAEAQDPSFYPPWRGSSKTGPCSAVTNVVIDASFAAYRPKHCGSWFHGFSKLTAIDGLANLDVSAATNLVNMFAYCGGLVSLDVSSFNTSNVTDMDSMFSHCSGLVSLDVSAFNTSNVTDMDSMFAGCTKLQEVDVSSFDTRNVVEMDYLFCDCKELSAVDVSGFKTPKVTQIKNMFANCGQLAEIDVSGFDTSHVESLWGLFQNCTNLVVLDVSSFDTSRVTDMYAVFDGCKKLKTIYASETFVTNAVTDDLNMFKNCTLLVGGNGTSYDANRTGMAYARIDGGPDNPGYFTDKKSPPPWPETVTVTITGRVNQVTYDGTEKSVSGYDIVTISDPLYKATDFRFDGVAFTNGTNAGTYPMGLAQSQFVNTNDNFAAVTFNVADGWLKIEKGTVPPAEDPGNVDPAVDPSDPGQVKDPTKQFSPWDYVGMYDGAAHTIDTNAMRTAYVAVMREEVTVQFAAGGGAPALPWTDAVPTFKDVVATSFWYKVSAANYNDIIHPCKVIITNRPVTVTSRDISKTFDGMPLKMTEEDISVTFGGGLIEAALPAGGGTMGGGLPGGQPLPAGGGTSGGGTVGGDVLGAPLAPGESFVYGDFGERTEVGTSPASFSVSAGPNTKLSNYDIHSVTGTITIAAAPTPSTTKKVVFDAIGGKIGIRTVVTQELESVYGTLPVATRENYLFQGWFLGVTNGAPQAAAGQPLLKAGDHTLFAKWTVDPTACDVSIFKWEAIDANTARITGFVNPNQQIAKMVIPETIGGRYVTEIADLAFSSAKCGTTEVSFPAFLTRIGERAFMSIKTTANAYSLKKITFAPVRRWDDPTKPGALTIGAYAFSSETPLKELTLPAEVASIGNYAFANCRQLSSITILGKPAIGYTVFRNAGVDVGGVTVHIDPALAGDAAYMAQIKGGLANVTVKTDAVVTGFETAGLTMNAPGKVTLKLDVARAAAWGQVDTSAIAVEYRATLDAAPTALAPTATENADGSVTLEVAVPQGGSGFFEVRMQ